MNSDYVLLNPVTDHADVLTVQQEDSLIVMIEHLESATGSQIGILTLPELAGQSLEELSLKYANETGLGRAGYNDGILIAVALADHQVRIEVGTGLEEIIKDDIAADIIRDDIAPMFRKERYASGLYAAIVRMSTLIRHNKDKIGKTK